MKTVLVRVGLVGLVLLGSLVLAAPAGALEVRLSVVPVKPRVGIKAWLEVRPYWPVQKSDGSCCDFEPASVDAAFHIEAVSPVGKVYRFRIFRSSDPHVWKRAVVFREPGRWVIRAPTWGPDYDTASGGRPRITVLVLPRKTK